MSKVSTFIAAVGFCFFSYTLGYFLYNGSWPFSYMNVPTKIVCVGPDGEYTFAEDPLSAGTVWMDEFGVHDSKGTVRYWPNYGMICVRYHLDAPSPVQKIAPQAEEEGTIDA